MTSVQGAIRTLLLGDTTVNGIVGRRIYPIVCPLDCTYPAISITRITNNLAHVGDYGNPRFQISCWATSYEQANALFKAVHACLKGYKGVASGVHIKQIVFLSSSDELEDDTGIFHIPADFKVRYTTNDME